MLFSKKKKANIVFFTDNYLQKITFDEVYDLY